MIQKKLYSWNKTLIPGPSNSLNLEAAETLERRRETLIRKAKEYHKELESLLVSPFYQPNPPPLQFPIFMTPYPFALYQDRTTSTSIYHNQPTTRTERKKPDQRTRTKRKTLKNQGFSGSTTSKHCETPLSQRFK